MISLSGSITASAAHVVHALVFRLSDAFHLPFRLTISLELRDRAKDVEERLPGCLARVDGASFSTVNPTPRLVEPLNDVMQMSRRSGPAGPTLVTTSVSPGRMYLSRVRSSRRSSVETGHRSWNGCRLTPAAFKPGRSGWRGLLIGRADASVSVDGHWRSFLSRLGLSLTIYCLETRKSTLTRRLFCLSVSPRWGVPQDDTAAARHPPRPPRSDLSRQPVTRRCRSAARACRREGHCQFDMSERGAERRPRGGATACADILITRSLVSTKHFRPLIAN